MIWPGATWSGRAQTTSCTSKCFFDPQGHTARGVEFSTVINGLHRAIVDARQALGVRASLIMCFLRHLDEADAERTLDAALAFKDRIVGVGLDSSEAGHPPSKFNA
jgi:adenosine deaminase